MSVESPTLVVGEVQFFLFIAGKLGCEFGNFFVGFAVVADLAEA